MKEQLQMKIGNAAQLPFLERFFSFLKMKFLHFHHFIKFFSFLFKSTFFLSYSSSSFCCLSWSLINPSQGMHFTWCCAFPLAHRDAFLSASTMLWMFSHITVSVCVPWGFCAAVESVPASFTSRSLPARHPAPSFHTISSPLSCSEVRKHWLGFWKI